jgi:hypothetical protein
LDQQPPVRARASSRPAQHLLVNATLELKERREDMSEDIPKPSLFDEATAKFKSVTSGAIRLALIVLFTVVAWRIAWSNFSLDLSKFDFSDLLAMILALFAMGMSVAFYFKSTDSSNQFYDNIYNFTQKTSEILGRIEERFGERLKHLDEGYGRIQSQFDGASRSPKEIEMKVKETEGKEEKEKEKLEETNKAMQQLMEKMTQRARLEEREKEEFYAKLQELESEKNTAQMRIREIEEDRNQMRHQLMMMEEGLMEESPEILHHPLIMDMIHHPEMRELLHAGAPAQIVQRHSRRFMDRLPKEHLEMLRDEGVINRKNEITPAGVILLRSMARRMGMKF